MTLSRLIHKNYLLKVGPIFMLAGIISFLLGYYKIGKDSDDVLWIIPHGLTIIYSTLTLIQRRNSEERKWYQLRPEIFAHFIVLCMISSYTLNNSFHVFRNLPEYFLLINLIILIPFILWPYKEVLPKGIHYLNAFITGLGIIVSAYLIYYVGELAALGIVAAFFFLISMNAISPYFLIIGQITYAIQNRYNNALIFCFTLGVLIPSIYLYTFANRWNNKVDYYKAAIENIDLDHTLPNWMKIGQIIEDDNLSQFFIQQGFEYHTQKANIDGFMSSYDPYGGRIKRMHDPLMIIAKDFLKPNPIDYQTRRKYIMNSLDIKKNSENRLWNGWNLSTDSIYTYTELFPEYRLAYTEKVFTIHNDYKYNRRRQQEAIYTFYLPDGTVPTSLSLWINGIEEKSRLTTKGNAQKAYSTIVGREKRDPAVLHWIDGNRVTVNVFPCTPEEDRKFKIGFTSPMDFVGDQLLLPSIYFRGPKMRNAKEHSKIVINGNKKLKLYNANRFRETKEGTYEYTGSYVPFWQLGIQTPELSTNYFSFNGKSFQATPLQNEEVQMDIENIYLDLNKQWTKEEVKQVLRIYKNQNVYYYDKGIRLLKASDLRDIDKLLKFNFSVFPFHLIQNINKSIVLTKGTEHSPELEDFEDCTFKKDLIKFFKENPTVHMISLNRQWANYMNPLKQMHIINGYEAYLSNLKPNTFFKDFNTENTKVIGNSKMIITELEGEKPSEAPDHLMRLFAYSDILHKIGPNYFIAKDYEKGELIDIAKEAHIVSPISSMIVLETLKDYDRFGIEKPNNKSLKNASTGNTGSVPEPHEWALIIIVLATITIYYRRRQNQAC